MAKKRQLVCAVCGDAAGYFEQHWNRDTGFGLCPRSARWLRDERRMPLEEMKHLYGEPGVNFSFEDLR